MNKFSIKAICTAFLIGTFLFNVSAPSKASAQTSSGGPIDSTELSTFVDDWMKENLENSPTPGVSISFVHDGKVLLNKGYGVNKIEKGEAVTENSIFRIASVSKTFVGIAVAQMVEKGMLDLDQDINLYLKSFQLKDDFSEPITLRHLLTHTAGFDEQVWADATLKAADQQALGEHLARMMPPRVMKSGRMISYSNYGYALAGYIVEEVSGMSFDAYVEENILRPLGMNRSNYRLTEDLKPHLAKGYIGPQETLTERPYTFVHRYPPTSMLTTADDMTRYMMAVLNGGQVGAAKIYGPVADNLIRSALYTPDPAMPGQTAGFMQWNRWGHEILWHDGAHVGFTAELMLFPELKSGFFIASNHKDGQLISNLKYALLERFYQPERLESIEPPFQTFTDHKALEGTYVNSRRSHGNFTKIRTLFEQKMEITTNQDGSIRVFDIQFAEEEADMFAYVNRPDLKLKVIRDSHGGIDYIAFDFGGSSRAYENLTGLDTPFFHISILIGALVLFAGIVIYWLIGLLRFSKGRNMRLRVRGILLPSFVSLVFLLLFAVQFITIDFLDVRLGTVPTLWFILSLPLLNIPILLYGIVLGIKTMRMEQSANFIKALWLTGIIANIIFLFELNYWNLLGFNFLS